MVIWEHKGHVQNMIRRRVFSTFIDWVFDQSEHVQGPIYILIIYNIHEYLIFLHHHLSTIFNMARATGTAFEKKLWMIVTQLMVNERAL